MVTVYKNKGMIVILVDGLTVATMTIGEWSKIIARPVEAI